MLNSPLAGEDDLVTGRSVVLDFPVTTGSRATIVVSEIAYADRPISGTPVERAVGIRYLTTQRLSSCNMITCQASQAVIKRGRDENLENLQCAANSDQSLTILANFALCRRAQGGY